MPSLRVTSIASPTRSPAVADADPERRVGPERRRDDDALDQLAVVHLERPPQLEVVAGAAADERHAAAEDGVGAADDLLLVAGEAVGEQQQRRVLARLELGHGGRDLGAGVAQPAGPGGGGGAHAEAGAAEGDHDHAVVGGTAGGDLGLRSSSRSAGRRRPQASIAPTSAGRS